MITLSNKIVKHIKYFQYVWRHKVYVYRGCRRLKLGLWQSLIHDWTKFMPVEWFPYVEQFYGDTAKDGRDSSGYFNAAAQEDAFVRAWLHHQHMNPHHWQHHLIRMDSGDVRVLKMPDKYVREMVADWFGAGLAQAIAYNDGRKPNPKTWYERNKDHILVHPETAKQLEYYLEYASTWPECQ